MREHEPDDMDIGAARETKDDDVCHETNSWPDGICRERKSQARCAQSIFSLSSRSFSHDIGGSWRAGCRARALKTLKLATWDFTVHAEAFITQGAVSHQVKALEGRARNEGYFNRQRRHVVIAETRPRHLAVVRDAFDQLPMGPEHRHRASAAARSP